MANIDEIRTENGARLIVRHDLPGEFVLFRRILYYLLNLLELVIAARFILKLLGANPNGGFSSFIYRLSGPLVAPFGGIIPATLIQPGGIFEWSSLIAIAVWAIVGYAIVRLVRILIP